MKVTTAGIAKQKSLKINKDDNFQTWPVILVCKG